MDTQDSVEIKQLEGTLRSNNAGDWISAVENNNEKDVDYLMLTLGAFAGEPDLLYAALRYASIRGVAVLVAPQRSPME